MLSISRYQFPRYQNLIEQTNFPLLEKDHCMIQLLQKLKIRPSDFKIGSDIYNNKAL